MDRVDQAAGCDRPTDTQQRRRKWQCERLVQYEHSTELLRLYLKVTLKGLRDKIVLDLGRDAALCRFLSFILLFASRSNRSMNACDTPVSFY